MPGVVATGRPGIPLDFSMRPGRSPECKTCFQSTPDSQIPRRAHLRNAALKFFAQSNTIAARYSNCIMAHTPFAKLLRHAASIAAQSDRHDVPADDSAMPRREFIRTISTATAAVALSPSLFGATRVATSARVVVVGAGLAGLNPLSSEEKWHHRHSL